MFRTHSGAATQDLPRAYVASPDIYKLLAQSAESRVFEARWLRGAAVLQAPIPAHVIENIGSAECRLVMFEGP